MIDDDGVPALADPSASSPPASPHAGWPAWLSLLDAPGGERGDGNVRRALALGGRFGEVPGELAWQMLDAFRDAGGVVIDTAHSYANGESERVIGGWLASRRCRDDMLIVDKVCHPDADGTPRLAPSVIHAEVEESLARLGIDRIDLLLMHRDDARVPVEPILDALLQERAAGRVRTIGTSNWTHQRLEDALRYRSPDAGGFSVSSCHLSLAVLNEMPWPGALAVHAAALEWHERTQTPLLAWSAQARGWFSGRPLDSARADETVIRLFDSPRNRHALERCREVAAARGVTATAVALAWLLARPFPVTAVIGPETLAELQDAVGGCGLRLSQDELRALAELRDTPRVAGGL